MMLSSGDEDSTSLSSSFGHGTNERFSNLPRSIGGDYSTHQQHHRHSGSSTMRGGPSRGSAKVNDYADEEEDDENELSDEDEES
jgi:hypothetical protein